jgi:hypothetical protein
MHTFSIFRKRDRTIVDLLQFDNYSEFRKYYFALPAPEDYGWNEINPVPKEPYQLFVIESMDNGCVTRLPLDEELIERIAKFNTFMTAGQVHHDLLRGKTIYTSFRAYTLE